MWLGERIGERVEKSFLEVRICLALRRLLFGGGFLERLGWFWCLDEVIRREEGKDTGERKRGKRRRRNIQKERRKEKALNNI